jgi:hypothetical protein
VSFGRAFAVGALIVVVASACYVATWELIYHKIAPDFVAKWQAHMLEEARVSGESPAEIEKRVADMQRMAELYRNPLINAAITFIEPLPVGLVFALVSAGILGRRPRRRTAAEDVAQAI